MWSPGNALVGSMALVGSTLGLSITCLSAMESTMMGGNAKPEKKEDGGSALLFILVASDD